MYWKVYKNARRKVRNATGGTWSELCCSDHVPPSFKTGNTEVLPDKAVGTYNSHFLNIIQSLNEQNVKDSSPISYLRNS